MHNGKNNAPYCLQNVPQIVVWCIFLLASNLSFTISLMKCVIHTADTGGKSK